MYKFISILIITIPSLSLACENKLIDIQIIPVQTQLQYSTQSSKKMTQDHKGSNSSSFTHTLGLFKDNMKYSYKVKPVLLTKNNVSCVYFEQIMVNIEMNPSIEISAEVMPFQCSKERVIRHEKQHYSIATNAFNSLPKFIKNDILKIYKSFNVNSKEEASKTIDKMNKSLMQEMQARYSLLTIPYHSQMDTKENYALEAKQCSDAENRQIHQILKK